MSTHAVMRAEVEPLSVDDVLESHRLVAGATIGIAAGVSLALPIVLYDLWSAGHTALELPMAVTAWLFGLSHFMQNGNAGWSIMLGILFFGGCMVLFGILFAGIADRVLAIRTMAGSIAAGLAWGVASFVFFWYVVLAIARDGAPFRATSASSLFVAPNWTWILGFVLYGITSGVVCQLIRDRAVR